MAGVEKIMATTQATWWTPREVANRFRVSPTTILRLLNAGSIVGKKVGGQWRVNVAAVNEYERDGLPVQRSFAKPDTSAFDNVPDYLA